jgi:hypothetical protein
VGTSCALHADEYCRLTPSLDIAVLLGVCAVEVGSDPSAPFPAVWGVVGLVSGGLMTSSMGPRTGRLIFTPTPLMLVLPVYAKGEGWKGGDY